MELKKAQKLRNAIQILNEKYQGEISSIIGEQNLKRYIELGDRLDTQVSDDFIKSEPTREGEIEVQKAQNQADSNS